MKRTLLVVFSFLIVFSSLAYADVQNVALNADVQLMGAPFFTGDYGDGYVSPKETVVDGIFLPAGRLWDNGSVWWSGHDGQERWIEIGLKGVFVIESFIVQADDNDAYELYYRDMDTNTWKIAWSVPNYDWYSWGMTTRPNISDNTERYMLPAPITTDALMFRGDMYNSDRFFSVSEIQAYGYPVAKTVAIDIKPDDFPNSINLGSKGVLPVAIFSTPDFDASTVDPSTVTLAGAPVKMKRNGTLMASVTDVNGDGIPDMLVHIDTEALGLSNTDTEAVLQGKTVEGTPITGKDSVRIIP